MWSWFNCYLSGRHEYGMWCEPGAIFLRCIHCGRRSPGWALDAKPQSRHDSPQTTSSTSLPARPRGASAAVRSTRCRALTLAPPRTI